jgi:hypothetical protein
MPTNQNWWVHSLLSLGWTVRAQEFFMISFHSCYNFVLASFEHRQILSYTKSRIVLVSVVDVGAMATPNSNISNNNNNSVRYQLDFVQIAVSDLQINTLSQLVVETIWLGCPARIESVLLRGTF